MVLFEKAGTQNTDETLRIALTKAKELGSPIVVASTIGPTAERVLELAKETGFGGPVVIVRGVSNKGRKGVNLMPAEVKKSLEERGATVVTAAHALSTGERAFSSKYKGTYPLEIMADTLRTLGQGVKVAFEISVMALEADAIPFGTPVVACGGTHRGVDAALVITPCYSAAILDTVGHEILCKPYDPSNAHIQMTF